MSDWDLICGDAWKLQVVNTAFFVGALGGAVIFSWLAEEFGASVHDVIPFHTAARPVQHIPFNPAWKAHALIP